MYDELINTVDKFNLDKEVLNLTYSWWPLSAFGGPVDSAPVLGLVVVVGPFRWLPSSPWGGIHQSLLSLDSLTVKQRIKKRFCCCAAYI
jgi:hypothetical protein